MKPKILSKKIVYKGRLGRIEKIRVKLPTGPTVNWERLIGRDFITVVPIDDENNVYLVKEWRVAWEKDVLRTPSGNLEGTETKNEKGVLNRARNELREEIGFDARKWAKLSTVPMGSDFRKRCHIYLARNLFKSEKECDIDEIIKVVKIPFTQAYKLLFSGKVLTTSYTLLAMSLAKEKLKI